MVNVPVLHQMFQFCSSFEDLFQKKSALKSVLVPVVPIVPISTQKVSSCARACTRDTYIYTSSYTTCVRAHERTFRQKTGIIGTIGQVIENIRYLFEESPEKLEQNWNIIGTSICSGFSGLKSFAYCQFLTYT